MPENKEILSDGVERVKDNSFNYTDLGITLGVLLGCLIFGGLLAIYCIHKKKKIIKSQDSTYIGYNTGTLARGLGNKTEEKEHHISLLGNSHNNTSTEKECKASEGQGTVIWIDKDIQIKRSSVTSPTVSGSISSLQDIPIYVETDLGKDFKELKNMNDSSCNLLANSNEYLDRPPKRLPCSNMNKASAKSTPLTYQNVPAIKIVQQGQSDAKNVSEISAGISPIFTPNDYSPIYKQPDDLAYASMQGSPYFFNLPTTPLHQTKPNLKSKQSFEALRKTRNVLMDDDCNESSRSVFLSSSKAEYGKPDMVYSDISSLKTMSLLSITGNLQEKDVDRQDSLDRDKNILKVSHSNTDEDLDTKPIDMLMTNKNNDLKEPICLTDNLVEKDVASIENINNVENFPEGKISLVQDSNLENQEKEEKEPGELVHSMIENLIKPAIVDLESKKEEYNKNSELNNTSGTHEMERVRIENFVENSDPYHVNIHGSDDKKDQSDRFSVHEDGYNHEQFEQSTVSSFANQHIDLHSLSEINTTAEMFDVEKKLKHDVPEVLKCAPPLTIKDIEFSQLPAFVKHDSSAELPTSFDASHSCAETSGSIHEANNESTERLKVESCSNILQWDSTFEELKTKESTLKLILTPKPKTRSIFPSNSSTPIQPGKSTPSHLKPLDESGSSHASSVSSVSKVSSRSGNNSLQWDDSCDALEMSNDLLETGGVGHDTSRFALGLSRVYMDISRVAIEELPLEEEDAVPLSSDTSGEEAVDPEVSGTRGLHLNELEVPKPSPRLSRSSVESGASGYFTANEP